jgi:nuclear pore complex protein Nup205
MIPGKITAGDVQYELNEDFKQVTLQVADILDLNELDSARLLITAQSVADDLDRPPAVAAIIQFHQRRQFLLESWRLILFMSTDPDINEVINLAEFSRQVISPKNRESGMDNQYWQKCFSYMSEIKEWVQSITDQQQKFDEVGSAPSEDLLEILDFQKISLLRQHESLAAICSQLIKQCYASRNEFDIFLKQIKALDKHDIILVHHLPILGGFIDYLGSPEGSCVLKEARSVHVAITSPKDTDTWGLKSVHAAAVVWWLAEYSGRYIEPPTGSPMTEADLDKEAEERSQRFMTALKDGAFHFLLSVCRDIRLNDWYEPARAGLVLALIQDTPSLFDDGNFTSPFFQKLLMEHLQNFSESFISHMPDTIRRLRTEEDEQRKLLHSRFQRNSVEYELHLERFLMIICYAYDGFSEAGQTFWEEPDGNLQGFLQWAARRQATPRIAAFCEMLRAISSGDVCAEHAHRFLSEDGSGNAGRIRRTSTLSYSLIFAELQYYATHIKDKSPPAQTAQNYGSTQNPNDLIVEPESALMLESYLRLLAHLCEESNNIRTTLLQPNLNLVTTLFTLSSFKVESRLRASIFNLLAALLKDKKAPLSQAMWNQLDLWVRDTIRGGRPTSSNIQPQDEDSFWLTLANGYDESNAIVNFLRMLSMPSLDDVGLNDALPFPEDLGSDYRIPGIDQYVDFVMGKVFINDRVFENAIEQETMRANCLTYALTCLSTFNDVCIRSTGLFYSVFI